MTVIDLMIAFAVWFLMIYIASTTVSIGWWVAVIIYFFGLLLIGAN